MRDELVRILQCPITGAALRRLDGAEIEAINGRIAAGELAYVDGETVDRPLQAGLASESGAYVFPVEDDIAILLADRAVALDAGAADRVDAIGSVKGGNRTFYDEVGWAQDAEGHFGDAVLFEDLRPVSADYISHCHLRVNRYLDPEGQFFLDAASGPVQFPEYLTYSAGYDARVCVDFSYTALRQAKQVLGERGEYVLADVTRLPFRTGTIDGGVSLHTIYHVPSDEQETAFREMHRVLAPGRRFVVVYEWHHSVMRLFQAPFLLARAIGAVLRKLRPGPAGPSDAAPDLYFHPHSQRWFLGRSWGFPYEIAVWRSVSVLFLQRYVRGEAGRRLLRWVYRLEERFPRLLGTIGEYPLIVLQKPASGGAQYPKSAT